MKKYNHAYMPKLGTLTASKDLINDVIHNKANFVYEFDLVQFFPNVDKDQLNRQLKNREFRKITCCDYHK